MQTTYSSVIVYRDASEAEKRFVRTGDFFVFTIFMGAVIVVCYPPCLNSVIVYLPVFPILSPALHFPFMYFTVWSSKYLPLARVLSAQGFLEWRKITLTVADGSKSIIIDPSRLWAWCARIEKTNGVINTSPGG